MKVFQFWMLFHSCVLCGILLYPNFNTIGITVTSSDNACSDVKYCVGELCAFGAPLVKIAQRSGKFYGSLLNLSPNTNYKVTVECDDDTFEASTSTRKDYELPKTFSQTLHVNASGSGTSCSNGSPCSITEALGKLTPGTRVLFKSGDYHEGEFSVSTDGTSQQPILFEGESGAVFNGANTSALVMSPGSGGGVHTTDINGYTTTQQAVMIKDGKIQRLLKYENETKFNNLEYVTYGYFIDGDTLKVNIGTLDASDYDFYISMRNRAFEISGDYVYFSNLYFKHYGLGGSPKALYFNGGSYGFVRNCTFNHNDRSIGIKRLSNNILIEDNVFFDSKFNFSWQGVKNNDKSQEGGAISAYSSNPMSARGVVVRRNTFHDFFDGFGLCPEKQGSETLTNEIDIHDNHIYNIGDDALECDGMAANVRIWNNRIENVLVGISLAPSIVGPVWVFNNRIVSTGKGFRSGGDYSGMAFKFNVGSSDTSGILHIYHNYVDTKNAGSSAHVIYEGKWEKVILRNNILIGDEYSISVGYTGQPMDFNYDGLYCRRNNELVYWTGLGDKHLYPISEVRSSVGQELNGVELSTDDIFEGGDVFDLKSNSGLVGAGVHIKGLNDDQKSSNIGLLKQDDFVKLRILPFVPRDRTGAKVGRAGMTGGDAFTVTFFVLMMIICCCLGCVFVCFIAVISVLLFLGVIGIGIGFSSYFGWSGVRGSVVSVNASKNASKEIQMKDQKNVNV